MLAAHLQRRRDAVAAAWDLADEVVLIGAGEPIPVPGRGDQTYPFRAHAEYFYLTDRERPGGVLAFDPKEGWTDFVAEVSEEERVWGGAVPSEGTPRSRLKEWRSRRQGLPVAALGCPLPEIEADLELSGRLREQLTHARRPKDAEELGRIRKAAAATAAGFAAARDAIRPGVTERDVQIEIEAAFFRAGAQQAAYDTIVGSGPNAAILHFAPTGRVLAEGELVLIDAGAEVDGYAADVSRTYPVGERFTPEQRALYTIVLEAQQVAIGKCRAGKEYRDIHLEACADLAEGLVDFGLLRGDPGALVERDAHALFFPHGIGHLVGLGVRDASGYLPGRKRSDRAGLAHLRCDLPLKPGYVMTIEPGIYFVPALLDDPRRREEFREEVDWSRVDALRGAGGIRIEDDVLVTDGRPEVLTGAIEKFPG
ncbi:MAG: aminopeptidase P N-terminal domain-containing protein [Planctomycetota bacterium]|jgi:Xaa-Pro aminopeptidase